MSQELESLPERGAVFNSDTYLTRGDRRAPQRRSEENSGECVPRTFCHNGRDREELSSEELTFCVSRVATWAEICAVAASMDGTQEGVSPPAELITGSDR
ncbi:hypothetical protein B296_00034909 [Ensete ventricosum]|uniref:Uncharacterized protein n=1 Tax=Ensete ventricosum TaxID=4639 RepID=A0A427A6X0_ENSVE|nr:hypothetical protein B296_00034909 [Ensete ventricosum]